MSKGGRRPGAGRPALAVGQLKRKDLAGYRILKRDRPVFDLHSGFEDEVVPTLRLYLSEGGI